MGCNVGIGPKKGVVGQGTIGSLIMCYGILLMKVATGAMSIDTQERVKAAARAMRISQRSSQKQCAFSMSLSTWPLMRSMRTRARHGL